MAGGVGVKVGLVSPYDLGRPGGVQQQVLELSKLLEKSDASVTLVGPGAGAHGGFDVGRVVPVRANGSVVPLALGLGIAGKLRTLLSDVDVVHVHEPLMPAVGLAALRSGRPLVTTFHARPPEWMVKSRGLVPKSWFRKALITAVSTEAALIASALGEVEIIPVGLNVADFDLGVPRRLDRAVFLGRDEPRKGLRVLLEAWQSVISRHPQAELVVIGSSGDGRMETGVTFTGRVSDEEKRVLLASAGLMAAPNLGGESFGLVVAEAMAAGCAVVASDIPAFRSVTGGAAVLVPAGDSAALASALSDLLADAGEIERRSLVSRARAAEFDWSRVLPAYVSCYERAVAGAAMDLG
jgi:phosphatidylinositol alpha-mannosyltransferase